MSVIHNPKEDKSELGRRMNTKCIDKQCCWCLPETDPRHLSLPTPFPMRFQHLIATDLVQRCYPACPSLFCGKVGEGEIDPENGIPGWLFCREANCDKCGFSVRFPPCPTVSTLPAVTCRVMSSSVKYLEWVVGGEQDEQPKRKKMGETDQLVEMKLPGQVFLRYVNECMDLWCACRGSAISHTSLCQDATLLCGATSVGSAKEVH